MTMIRAELHAKWGAVTSPDELHPDGSAAARAVPSHLLSAPLSAPPRLRPAEALERLAAQLPAGTRTTLRTDGILAVLSTPGGSVWCNGRIFWWATADAGMTWPAADCQGAAARLTEPK